MDTSRSHRSEMMVMAVALVAIGAGTAYYFYISNKKPKGCLEPDKFKEFKLIKRTELSHNVAKFKFALPTPNSVLGLPIGQHMSCKGRDAQGEEVIKAYTPTTLDSDVGYFELVIKMYPQGRMSHHFREMHEGAFLSVKGPKMIVFFVLFLCVLLGLIEKLRETFILRLCFFRGGSSINLAKLWLLGCLLEVLELLQCSRAILENPRDDTNIHLIYANVTYDDILLKDELDNLALNFPTSFTVYYVLNEPPEGWSGGVGFVSKEMIEAHCPSPAPHVQILRCGPPPMNKAMAAHLESIGYTPQMQFQF